MGRTVFNDGVSLFRMVPIAMKMSFLFWLCAMLVLILGVGILAWPLKHYRHARKIGGIALMIMAVIVVGLYGYWGSSSLFKHVRAYQAITVCLEELNHDKAATSDEVLEKLEALAQTIRYSHEGLARLGLIYSELGQYSEAGNMFEKAMQSAPENGSYALQWIYHQSFLHQGKLPLLVRKKAEMLLQDPNVALPVRNMLAMDDYFQGNYDEAVTHWESILDNDKTLTEERRLTLLRAIGNAKARQ